MTMAARRKTGEFFGTVWPEIGEKKVISFPKRRRACRWSPTSPHKSIELVAGGLQPSEFASATLQIRTDSARSVVGMEGQSSDCFRVADHPPRIAAFTAH